MSTSEREFQNLLRTNEAEALNVLTDMVPFGHAGVKTMTCPWLRFWEGLNRPAENVKGILIMQDWGTAEKNTDSSVKPLDLDGQVSGIKSSFRGIPNPEFEDRTIITLRTVGQEALKRKIADGTWVVMNAVWGCRKEGKCGYLGKAIHSAAFPIWSGVVAFFTECTTNLSVVFAGDWARFDEMKGFHDLSRFIRRWTEWTKRKETDWSREIKGKAFFASHPCTWNVGGRAVDATGFINDPSQFDW